MNAIDALESLFKQGTITNRKGEVLCFEGVLSGNPKGLARLEQQLGYTLPAEIAEFVVRFGGTKVFIDRYGLGTQILAAHEVASRNLELQDPDDQFWPRFAILGFDPRDDMLCVHKAGDEVHFGILDHQDWGYSELWAREGMMFAPFDKWLKMFVESKGMTLPGRDITYEI